MKWLIMVLVALVIAVSGCTQEGIESETTTTLLETTTTVAYQPAELSLSDVFQGYRKSLEDHSFDDYKKYVAAASIVELETLFQEEEDREEFNKAFIQIASLIIAFAPDVDDVIVEQETIDGDSATWTVSDKSNPDNKGTITFVKEDGQWKMLEESWEESTSS